MALGINLTFVGKNYDNIICMDAYLAGHETDIHTENVQYGTVRGNRDMEDMA